MFPFDDVIMFPYTPELFNFTGNGPKSVLDCYLAKSRLSSTYLKGKETQHSFPGLSNIYISGMWLWYTQALFINRVKQNRCLKSENPQPMVVTILPPCSGKQMWMWCSVVSSPAWWLITLSPIPEAARCQLLLRAGQLRYLIVSARKLPPKLQWQEMINITYCFSN